MIKTENLILQILKEAINLGTRKLTTTKLVKMLYLIECEYYKQKRERLTDLNWIFYLYGPYAHELSHVLNGRINLIETDQVLIDAERTANLVGISDPKEFEDKDFINNIRAESITKSIIRQWCYEDLRALLNHVYHETEPMQGVKRGDTLDFASIPEPLPASLYQLSPDKIRQIRKHLSSISKPKKVVKPLYPLPALSKEWKDKIEKALESELANDVENLTTSSFFVPVSELKGAFEDE